MSTCVASRTSLIFPTWSPYAQNALEQSPKTARSGRYVKQDSQLKLNLLIAGMKKQKQAAINEPIAAYKVAVKDGVFKIYLLTQPSREHEKPDNIAQKYPKVCNVWVSNSGPSYMNPDLQVSTIPLNIKDAVIPVRNVKGSEKSTFDRKIEKIVIVP